MNKIPIVPICFWCSGERRQVVLVDNSAIKNREMEGKKTVKAMVDYIPCHSCHDAMSKGITLVEVADHPYMSQPCIFEGLFPTGKWSVVGEDFIKREFSEKDYNRIFEKRTVLIPINQYRRYGLDPYYIKLN